MRERVQREAPGLYSKDLIEQIFRKPYCKIAFLERAGMGTRQTCSVPARAEAAGRADRPEDRPRGVFHQPGAVRAADAMRLLYSQSIK